MKNLKILFSVLLLSIFALSCSSDSSGGTKVKYQINGIDDTITQVNYKNGDGNIISATANQFGGNSDSKTVKVPDSELPFTAQMNISANNTTATVKHYDLLIYVNGEVKAETNFSAPPNATSSSGTVSFIITE